MITNPYLLSSNLFPPPRDLTRERNSHRTSTMRQRHPPNRGIMSPEMRFATIVPRDKTPPIKNDIAHSPSAGNSQPAIAVFFILPSCTGCLHCVHLSSRPPRPWWSRPSRFDPFPIRHSHSPPTRSSRVVSCLSQSRYAFHNSLSLHGLRPVSQPVVGRSQQQYNGPLGSPRERVLPPGRCRLSRSCQVRRGFCAAAPASPNQYRTSLCKE
jgi:hypothetical protein